MSAETAKANALTLLNCKQFHLLLAPTRLCPRGENKSQYYYKKKKSQHLHEPPQMVCWEFWALVCVCVLKSVSLSWTFSKVNSNLFPTPYLSFSKSLQSIVLSRFLFTFYC